MDWRTGKTLGSKRKEAVYGFKLKSEGMEQQVSEPPFCLFSPIDSEIFLPWSRKSDILKVAFAYNCAGHHSTWRKLVRGTEKQGQVAVESADWKLKFKSGTTMAQISSNMSSS